MSETPEIDVHHQTAFGEDGELEVTETSVETSLEDFGAEVDHRERKSRRDQPKASEFGVDDRPEVKDSTENNEQAALFPDTDDDQQTLTGENAAARCLFDD